MFVFCFLPESLVSYDKLPTDVNENVNSQSGTSVSNLGFRRLVLGRDLSVSTIFMGHGWIPYILNPHHFVKIRPRSVSSYKSPLRAIIRLVWHFVNDRSFPVLHLCGRPFTKYHTWVLWITGDSYCKRVGLKNYINTERPHPAREDRNAERMLNHKNLQD